MEFKTNDGYLIKKGNLIKYTGDMANIEGLFEVTKIEPCEWYKYKITLTETTEHKRILTLTPSSFDSGAGRRFKPAELVKKEWQEAYNQLTTKREWK